MSARDEGGAYARIRENLSELGLDAMAAGLPHWMSAVAAGEADFASAMLAMTSEEAEAKRRRGTDRKVRAAGFPFVKTLADFDFSFQPSIPRAVVDDLAALRFLDAAENVVLVGSPGVGKTHIAVALGVEAVRARKEVRFTDCAALVRDLKDASSRGILAKRLKYYAHATLQVEALRVVHADEPRVQADFADVGATLGEALDTVRASVHALRESSVDLSVQMRKVVADVTAAAPLAVELDVRCDRVPPNACSCLLAVTREALSNVLRHAGAERVVLRCVEQPGFFQLEVTDDGTARSADGTAADGTTALYDADLKGPAAIVIGSEGSGMGRLGGGNCDFLVRIPMRGKLNSLNASAAAAILLYEAVRQRML